MISSTHALIYIALSVVWAVPLCELAKRTGRPPFIGLIAFLPLGGLALVWFFAYWPWPVRRV